MAESVLSDRIAETTTTSSTGTVTLLGAKSSFLPFSGLVDGTVVDYCIAHQTINECEFGMGTIGGSGTTLARTKVMGGSNGTSAVNFSAGTKDVFISPSWSRMLVNNAVAGGRLTLTSATPVTITDVTAAQNVYYTPYTGNRIALWNGNGWIERTFSELTLSLAAQPSAFMPLDIFAQDVSGAATLQTENWAKGAFTVTIASPAVVTYNAHGMNNGDPVVLATTGALPTGLAVNTRYFVLAKTTNTFQLGTSIGASGSINTSGSQSGTHTAYQARQRATNLVLLNGRWVSGVDNTLRYLGSIYTSTSQIWTEDSVSNRYVSNVDNRVPRQLLRKESTASWTYQSTTVRQANGASANKVEVFLGLSDIFMMLKLFVAIGNSATDGGSSGIGVDVLNANNADIFVVPGSVSTIDAAAALLNTYQQFGWHQFAWVENCRSTTAPVTFYGAQANAFQSGLEGYVLG